MIGEKHYVKRGNRYVAVNDPHAYDGLSEGTWLVVVKEGGVSCRTLIKPKCMELEAALYFLHDGLCDAMSKKAKLRPQSVRMSPKEIKAWKAYEKIMGEDVPRYFSYPSFSDMADSGCEYLRKIILENGFDVKKISEKIQNIDMDSVNPIKDLEI